MSGHKKLDESDYALKPLSHQTTDSETLCANLTEVQHYSGCTGLPILQTTRTLVLKWRPRLRCNERVH